ncbi:MAG TPA: MarR family transcriptional regulator [Pusillimonas sp.]|uniref:MarR family winged helix-turn-helix transcriptional regulator n=1 Tax=Pusillimonas sp. TaxID=3040095 RepID=UPI002C73D810|nr:MarR family transcriptional regulator [Pusillimonas sp.]HUH87525.1 MarR family transcriptional regulator [Pusillimonas sp.]
MASAELATQATTAAQAQVEQPAPGLKPPLMQQLLGYHCRRAFIRVQPFSDVRMASFKLRPADFAVLSLLSVNPGISQKQVAQGIGVAPPNLAPVLERLQARKLIMRRRSPHDGRIQSFSLTPAGKSLCEQAEATALQIEEQAAHALSRQERDTLIDLLRKLYESVDDHSAA